MPLISLIDLNMFLIKLKTLRKIQFLKCVSCIDLISVQEMFLKFEFSYMSSFEQLKEAIDPRKSFLTNVLVGGMNG